MQSVRLLAFYILGDFMESLYLCSPKYPYMGGVCKKQEYTHYYI